jgi:uncharacterized protein
MKSRSATGPKADLLVVHETGRYGKGVFARRPIEQGSCIHVLRGDRLTLEQMFDRIMAGDETATDPLHIGRRTYLDLDELSRTFNHSCEPTAGIRKTSELFALRDIAAGEEITFDYSMTVAPTEWSMPCKCGSSLCRQIISDVRSVPKSRRDEYLQQGAVQRYMRSVLRELDAGTYLMPDYERRALERLGLSAGASCAGLPDAEA